ncbi:MAG: hypothetical protein FJ040_12900 [Chloroflexi bacterium]|nr:hypothetical protein [Chloroflexota bacterium]
MTIFYHDDVTKTAHAFDTTRKGADVARLLQERGWHITTPQPLNRTIAERYHDGDYIDALIHGEPRAWAESQGFTWDTYMWSSVTAQSGAMVDAALYACEHGRAYALSAGFHHAQADTGAGFCTLNGLAIAAGEVLARYSDRNVILLDADAHCGGGTMSICAHWDRFVHLDIHTNYYDSYPLSQPHVRHYINNADDYLPTLKDALERISTTVNAGDVLLYNAGMDVHEDCRIGGLAGMNTDLIRQREVYVSQWAAAHNLCVVACLAGGYAGGHLTHQTLVELHAMSVEVFLSVINNS